jgi:hypothetical protein
MAYKLPVLLRESSEANVSIPNLASFQWEDVKDKHRLCEGSYSDVFSGEYQGFAMWL